MKTWGNIARYHLLMPRALLLMPWVVLAAGFLVDGQSAVRAPASQHAAAYTTHHNAGGVAIIYFYFFVIGVTVIGRSLPFALALGNSRRSYYTGTALLGLALAVADGLGLTALQAIERATDGWGVGLNFFRAPYILDGPWYQTWLTSSVGLAVLFCYGMWFGIVYRRWSLAGAVAFTIAQAAVVTIVIVTLQSAGASSAVGHFFGELTAVGLTGLFAVLAALLVAGGQATIRRAAV
jgi:hypothetical protein